MTFLNQLLCIVSHMPSNHLVVALPIGFSVVCCRLQQRITMLQAMVDSPEEAEGWDAPQGERPTSAGGTMTSSTLHRILQVTYRIACTGQQ